MSQNIATYRVLIFPGGTESGLEIFKSLKDCKNIKIFSASSNIPNNAFFTYDVNEILPDISKENWIGELNDLIAKHKIDLIYPAHVYIIDKLSMHRKEINAKILLAPEKIIKLVRSKRDTILSLKDIIDVPEIYDTMKDVTKYPVFVKPDNSYGEQGASLINNKSHLLEVLEKEKNSLIQELLPGKEYSIDCFSKQNGELLFSRGRERERIRMGTSMHAKPIDKGLNEYFSEVAKKIIGRIGIYGAWFFQMKRDIKGKLKLLEIEPRIAGTMCYHRIYGVNFSLLNIYEHLGINTEILVNDLHIELDRCLHNKYKINLNYKYVYIDLDDTIISHGSLNLDIIKFLYKCINNNKKIILISKSLDSDKENLLKKWKIDRIFDQVIWLKEDQSKADFIDNKDAIFIDDSFSQRKEVWLKLAIPTFDPSMIEVLL